MGDHRADIKLSFAIHGKTYEQSMWINWTPDEDGCDRRVTGWFAGCWEEAKARYEAFMREQWERTHAEDIERSERAQLIALKAKYPDA